MMSRLMIPCTVLLLTTLAACEDDRRYTYTLDAELVIPAEVALTLDTPALVEVVWMGETHGASLICEQPDGERRAHFSGEVETAGHASHQAFTARVATWPTEAPCDPELVGIVPTETSPDAPHAHTFVFEDDLNAHGGREADRAESITVELRQAE